MLAAKENQAQKLQNLMLVIDTISIILASQYFNIIILDWEGFHNAFLWEFESINH